ncbi:MAG: MarR family transcriptional regulator [Luteitalea sp.]|nr:MarR family transcriptional regulator [Luteitalea sp.]
MSTRLQAELKQTKPFVSVEDAVFLSALRTADHLLWGEIEVLKVADLTFPQYNVLRILRGAGPKGLSCREISERMVTRDPDMTRLLDRLERRGLVARLRDAKDRRVVLTRVTPDGLKLLRTLDAPVAKVQRRQLEHMSQRQLRTLVELLDLARQATG